MSDVVRVYARAAAAPTGAAAVDGGGGPATISPRRGSPSARAFALLPMSGNAAAKWIFLAIVGAVDSIWMNIAGFHFGTGSLPCAAGAGLLVAIALFYFYMERDDRIVDFAHFGAQFLVLSLVMVPLEYLAVSTNLPLADPAFAAIDRASGLSWVSWAQWVLAHPAVHEGLFLAYNSLWPQAILAFVYNTHTRSGRRNSELWWITAIASLVTIAGGGLAPALSAWVYHGLATVSDFPHMLQFVAVRAGTLHVIDLADTRGLIQLPSFHTVLAIMLAYNFRHHRWLFSAAVFLNALVIVACPTEGGHLLCRYRGRSDPRYGDDPGGARLGGAARPDSGAPARRGGRVSGAATMQTPAFFRAAQYDVCRD